MTTDDFLNLVRLARWYEEAVEAKEWGRAEEWRRRMDEILSVDAIVGEDR